MVISRKHLQGKHDQLSHGRRYGANRVAMRHAERQAALEKRFAESKVRDESGKLKVMYHGGGAVGFDAFDPQKQDPDALYGPGFYFTDNTDVATGYAGKRGGGGAPFRSYGKWGDMPPTINGETHLDMEQTERLNKAAEQYANELDAEYASFHELAARAQSPEFFNHFGHVLDTKMDLERVRQGMHDATGDGLYTADIDFLHNYDRSSAVFEEIVKRAGMTITPSKVGPGVVPVYLDIRNPLDLTKSVKKTTQDKIGKSMFGAVEERVGQMQNVSPEVRKALMGNVQLNWNNVASADAQGADDFYRKLQMFVNIYWGSWAAGGQSAKVVIANVLKQAGFDGIRHVGGQLAGGGKLLHDVWIAFEPTQIESIFNPGTFDPNDPSMVKALKHLQGKHDQKLHGRRSGAGSPSAGRTEQFNRWFSGSKIVDADGNPKPVYHGTTAGGFTVFKWAIKRRQQLGFGIHFAAEKDVADKYATGDAKIGRAKKGKPEVFEVYLNVKNPLIANAIAKEGSPEFALAEKIVGKNYRFPHDMGGKRIIYMQNAIDQTNPQRAIELIKAAGFDGIIYEAVHVRRTGINTGYRSDDLAYVVFDSNQVKLVTNTTPTSDPDITKELRLKHLAGQHNQKRHGWRYGSSGAAKRSMTGQAHAENQEYKRRARGKMREAAGGASAQLVNARRVISEQRSILAKAREKYEVVDRRRSELLNEEHRLAKEYQDLNKQLGRAVDVRDAARLKQFDAQRSLEVARETSARIEKRLENQRGWELPTEGIIAELKIAKRKERAAEKALQKAIAEHEEKKLAFLEIDTKLNELDYNNEMKRVQNAMSEAKLEAVDAIRAGAKATDDYMANTETSRAIALEGGTRAAAIKRHEIVALEATAMKRINDLYKDFRSRDFRGVEHMEQTMIYDAEIRAIRNELDRQTREILAANTPLELEAAWDVGAPRRNGGEAPVDQWRDGMAEFQALVPDNPLMRTTPVEITSKIIKGGRSFCDHQGNPTMDVDEERASALVHEMGHSLEDRDPAIRVEMVKFLKSRMVGEPILKLKDLDPGFRDDELYFKDKWFDPYMGKLYRYMSGQGWEFRSTELLSMGMQLFYTCPALLGRDDPDFFDFIYAVVRLGGD